MKAFGPDTEAKPEAYVPLKQDPWQSMALVVRTTSDPGQLTALVRREVREIDSGQPVYDVRTMEQRLSETVASQRLAMLLMTVFAALALLLAVVGIYGVMAYSVSLRTREMGLRLALGARPRDVLRLVVWQGVQLALIAVGLGLLGAFGLTRFLSSLLYEVSVVDSAVFVGAPLLLVAVALLACFIPASRAARLNPLEAIRYE